MKRKRKTQRDAREGKRQKLVHGSTQPPAWTLLRQYYPTVLTLRRYLASRLPKNRRKRVLHYGRGNDNNADADVHVVGLLDSVTVGTFNHSPKNDEDLEKDITVFTQQVSESSATIGPTQGALKQSEIVDFVLWQLFRRHSGSHAPSHMLCRGYQKYATNSTTGAGVCAVPGVPGLFCNTEHHYISRLKKHPWSTLPSLLGRHGERILADLLFHCGLFEQVTGGSNLNQISGVPLSDLKPLPQHNSEPDGQSIVILSLPAEERVKQAAVSVRKVSDIRFLRHRMLYAKPVVSAQGHVRFGLGHAHALNQRQVDNEDIRAKHILKYVFPKQFGLHNVLASQTDIQDTSQPFMDYTDREKEIARLICDWKRRRGPAEESGPNEPPLPKRLRGGAVLLASRLLKRHSRSAYTALLDHYCPSPIKDDFNPETITKHASTSAQVSAFCRAVTSKVFLAELWGDGDAKHHNRQILLRSVDKFIRLRRYESLTLHDVLQRIQLSGIGWMSPEPVKQDEKMSQSDFTKRKELMAELLYYLFDSFLIPLIRGHFHVTESGAHRNQLFYFRHDVWKALSDPALAALKETMLEESRTANLKTAMEKRALGVSKVRLLPKEHGMRPIINLRRRMPRMKNGQLVLGKSINSILTPAFSVLNYEKEANVGILASAMFSVEDIYPCLQSFRQNLSRQGLLDKPLFFAKVDVKACFDTIPQQRLMELARTILAHDEYRIAKYARGKLIGSHNQQTPGFGSKPSWRFLTRAGAGKDDFDFTAETRADTEDGRTRSVYVDGVVQKSESRKAVLDLLEEHIQSNLIQLGNKYYRQKEGIPQGSIVSSLLCSYFYAEMERELLGFINDGRSILLRLIDDFLVISTERGVAERFLRVMHAGVPEYGVEVKAEKSRVNFEVEIGGRAVPRLPVECDFPYCGTAINTVTLDLSKDKERRKKSSESLLSSDCLCEADERCPDIPDSMSVEYSKLPGQTFYRKTLRWVQHFHALGCSFALIIDRSALKLQMQPMLLSTSYNRVPTVLSNLHHSFTEVAQKCYHYIHSLSQAKQPPPRLLIRKSRPILLLFSPKQTFEGEKCKTFSRRYSRKVTHCSTNHPIGVFSPGERTGSSSSHHLWPNVKGRGRGGFKNARNADQNVCRDGR
ncbi:Telomerase reverse transcriptase [Saxophila tyrrhenica]|uniref:Telomerase reverse transcriptase n=1 Tax=Saxophila tyrrhenica TaxID=1690608 RepID=A0AAV9NWM2_9PEZI|nr:Telomerase reverse transcriptase [Saxophila tyrrhenica]